MNKHRNRPQIIKLEILRETHACTGSVLAWRRERGSKERLTEKSCL